jgi:hypothetical protein
VSELAPAKAGEAGVRNGGCGTDPDLPQMPVGLPGTWFLAPDTWHGAAVCASLLPSVGLRARRVPFQRSGG